jgi:polysaccharide export outer membrane protein
MLPAIFLAVMTLSLLSAQERVLHDRQERSDEVAAQQRLLQQASQVPAVAREGTIDPLQYYVGPSDVIAVNVWISPPVSFNLTVTPEGTLIIPTVGEVSVAGLTLQRAKERIIAEVRKRYILGDVTATLVRPRPVVVTVIGNVLNPGLYTLSAVDRAHKAIEEANRPNRLQTQDELKAILEKMSMRNIRLRRNNGQEQRVDIALFLATKEDRWNSFLREGDVLIVSRRDPLKNVFGIYGEVNAPGRYEYVEGDSMLDALRIGQGFTALSRRDSVELIRFAADGKSVVSSVIDLGAIEQRRTPNIALQPGDRIVIKARDETRRDFRVTIEGEVRYPGVYPITRNQTRLSEVIRQAGGFTEYAWLAAATLNRRAVPPEEVEIERLISMRGGILREDSTYYLLETELRLRQEIVSVDFQRLFEGGDTAQDVILRNEDIIRIPSRKRTVYVFGQVVTSGHIPFAAGENVFYYIRKAGGLTERAREGDIKIIKAKTRQWLSPDETVIEEGDYVWVPKVPERPFSYYMSIIGQTASIVSVAVSVVLLVLQMR